MGLQFGLVTVLMWGRLPLPIGSGSLHPDSFGRGIAPNQGVNHKDLNSFSWRAWGLVRMLIDVPGPPP